MLVVPALADVDEAFTRIRAYPRGNNQKLTEVAHAIVADRRILHDIS